MRWHENKQAQGTKPPFDFAAMEAKARGMTTAELLHAIRDIQDTIKTFGQGHPNEGWYQDEASVYHDELRKRRGKTAQAKPPGHDSCPGCEQQAETCADANWKTPTKREKVRKHVADYLFRFVSKHGVLPEEKFIDEIVTDILEDMMTEFPQVGTKLMEMIRTEMLHLIKFK